MRFDVVIIGGGLSGLICGLRLQKSGKKCAIISAGQSAMHFSSGTFDLLGRMPDGTDVISPTEAIRNLGEEHPYSVIGHDKVIAYAKEAPEFINSCGIEVSGDCGKNTWRITPTGERKPSWLTISDFTALEDADCKVGDSILIVNILGYLDFNTKFLAESFERRGAKCRIVSIRLEELERLRKNPSEMRSTNIARVMDRDGIWEKAAEQIKGLVKDEDAVVIPAVFGLKDKAVIEKIRQTIGHKTIFAPTMPPSVPGIRSQMKLRSEFENAGGRFFLGDTVVSAKYDEEGKVDSISTVNFGDIIVHADHFVLATGSFFSKGLIATPQKVYEPIFGIDVTYQEKRGEWFNTDFWKKQNYISFGAKVNSDLNVSIDGKTVSNLYAIGSLIGGSNALYEGSGGGTAIISAMAAADKILEN